MRNYMVQKIVGFSSPPLTVRAWCRGGAKARGRKTSKRESESQKKKLLFLYQLYLCFGSRRKEQEHVAPSRIFAYRCKYSINLSRRNRAQDPRNPGTPGVATQDPDPVEPPCCVLHCYSGRESNRHLVLRSAHRSSTRLKRTSRRSSAYFDLGCDNNLDFMVMSLCRRYKGDGKKPRNPKNPMAMAKPVDTVGHHSGVLLLVSEFTSCGQRKTAGSLGLG